MLIGALMSQGRIFISYRRGADNNSAGRLYDRLEGAFGAERLFIDVDAIPPGVDFVDHLNEQVAGCDAFMAVIGKGWIDELPRLQDPNDFVRVEIEAALARPHIPIIPVLIDDASLPSADDLPESLQPIVRRAGVAIRHENFAGIVDGRLAPALRQAVGSDEPRVEPQGPLQSAAALSNSSQGTTPRDRTVKPAGPSLMMVLRRAADLLLAVLLREARQLLRSPASARLQPAGRPPQAEHAEDDGECGPLADADSGMSPRAHPRRPARNMLMAALLTAPVAGVAAYILLEQQGTLEPLQTFQDCAACPEMVVIPAGTFLMGSPETEEGHDADEGPQHEVTVERFALAKTEVTFDQWQACVDDGGCNETPDDTGWGRGNLPVINISWQDARQYVAWLNTKVADGDPYRLPSEAEWEYAARAGSTTPFAFGETISSDRANANFARYVRVGKSVVLDTRGRTVPVDELDAANAWGLLHMHGNIREWVEDCSHGDYSGAPTDGSAWLSENGGVCASRVLRGGSWSDRPQGLRSAKRNWSGPQSLFDNVGFRPAKTLPP